MHHYRDCAGDPLSRGASRFLCLSFFAAAKKVSAAPHRGDANRPIRKQGKANAVRAQPKSAAQAKSQAKANAIGTQKPSAAQAKKTLHHDPPPSGKSKSSVLNHILLPADKALSPHLHENIPRRNPILRLSPLGKQQKRRINPRIPKRQRIAINPNRCIHNRHNEVLGNVRNFKNIHTRLNPHPLAHRDKNFHRCITGASPKTRRRGIDPIGPIRAVTSSGNM
jgi:hypothetical protein